MEPPTEGRVVTLPLEAPTHEHVDPGDARRHEQYRCRDAGDAGKKDAHPELHHNLALLGLLPVAAVERNEPPRVDYAVPNRIEHEAR